MRLHLALILATFALALRLAVALYHDAQTDVPDAPESFPQSF